LTHLTLAAQLSLCGFFLQEKRWGCVIFLIDSSGKLIPGNRKASPGAYL
jgi:hypothetical protein